MSDDVVIRRVRAALAGKRVLVVSNRKDPQLKKTLEEALGLEVKWVVIPQGGGRKIRGVVESIKRGTYDVIIALTGFMTHGTGNALRGAAQRGGAQYVAAGRGRLTEAMGAIDRDLGLIPAAPTRSPADPDEVMRQRRLKRRLLRK